MSQDSSIKEDLATGTWIATYGGVSHTCKSKSAAEAWISDQKNEEFSKELKVKQENELQLEDEQRPQDLGLQPPIG